MQYRYPVLHGQAVESRLHRAEERLEKVEAAVARMANLENQSAARADQYKLEMDKLVARVILLEQHAAMSEAKVGFVLSVSLTRKRMGETLPRHSEIPLFENRRVRKSPPPPPQNRSFSDTSFAERVPVLLFYFTLSFRHMV